MLRDLKPTDNVGGFDVRPGNFLLNGATTVSGGVNFTIHSVYAVECTLLLFRPYAKIPYARLRFPDSYKIGNTYSMLVFGLDEVDFEYAYSFDGPYEPEKGIIFDKKKYILDPYAKAVIGQSGWGKKQEHEGVYKARVVNSDYDWGNCTQPKLPFEELIIYEMHVRGFTQDGSSGVKNKGTFAGIREKIPYLKELGINAVEMMPIFEFDEMGSYRNYDYRCDKLTVHNCCAVDCNLKLVKVDTTENTENRRNDVACERSYDCLKSRTDDNADCEIKHISTHYEFLKLRKKLFHFALIPFI